MRTISAAQQAVITSGQQAERIRVWIKDAGGTFRDLTTYPGFNAVKSVTWAEKVTDPHMTCDIVLLREMYALSLAPLVTTSAINRGFVTTASPAALVALTREVKVEVAIVPIDRVPASGDWFEVFRGRVDDYDAASGTDIKLGCRSLGGRLAQQYIKTEMVYSFAAVSGVAVPLLVWAPQIVVTAGQYLLPATRGTADPGYARFFVATASGTTGTTEPTWTGGTGITDGGVTWNYQGAPLTTGNPVEQVMQNIMDSNRASGDPSVTLYVPSSPSWAITQFIQQRQFVLDGILALAHQIGWDLRYKWRAGTAQFELTFSQPVRSSPSVDHTFAVGDYENPSKLAVAIADIRNSWRVVYSDSADLWPDGQAKRKVIEVADSASITKYGELWAEIQEDSTSQIDGVTQATALANAALSDCKEPTAELSSTLTRGFPWVELNDFYTFTANGLHFTADQSLAVTGWTQTHDGKQLKTQLDLRGLPTIGAATHISKTVHPYLPVKVTPPLITQFVGVQTPNTIATPSVGGVALVTSSPTIDKTHFDGETEVHLYTVPGTTLASTTLKHMAKGAQHKASVPDLVPGKTYYGKTVVRTFTKGRVVRGQPSAEFSVVAGRAQAGHYESTSTQSHLPLNGNFEHFTDTVANPPDHWVPTAIGGEGAEAWGSSVSYGTTVDHGYYINLANSSGTKRGRILSSAFEVRRALREANLYISFRRQVGSGAGKNLQAVLYFYSDAACTNLVNTTTLAWNGDGAGPYPSLNTWYVSNFPICSGTDLPANANFCRMALQRATTGDTTYAYDVGEVYFQEADFRGLVVDEVTLKDSLTVNYPAVITGTGHLSGMFLDSVTLDAASFINQQAWVGLPFGANWGNVGGGWMAGGSMVDSFGFVRLRGLVKFTGTPLTSTIATLPAGQRPSAQVQFPARCGTGVLTYVSISTLGVVAFGGVLADATGSVTLDGINFDTR